MTSQSCHKSLPALAKIVGSYFFAEDSPESERRKNNGLPSGPGYGDFGVGNDCPGGVSHRAPEMLPFDTEV